MSRFVTSTKDVIRPGRVCDPRTRGTATPGSRFAACYTINRPPSRPNPAGVQVWVVYPGTNKIYVYDSPTSVHILQVGDDLDGGSLLPGFRLPLAVLFQEGTED